MDRDLSPNKSEVAALTAPKTAAMIEKKPPKLTAGEYVGLTVDYARACLHTRSDAIL